MRFVEVTVILGRLGYNPPMSAMQPPTLPERKPFTFEEVQLWLSWGQVGIVVVLALVGLIFQLPQRLPSDGAFLTDWLVVVGVIVGFVVVGLPLDFVGMRVWGYFGRKSPTSPLAYFRGLFLHTFFYSLIAALLLVTGRANCITAVTGIMIVVMVTQIRLQPEIASAIGGMKKVVRDIGAERRYLKRWGLDIYKIVALEATDPAFAGGISSLPGRARIVVPTMWLDEMESEYAAVQLVRRAGAFKYNGRERGLLVAGAFNLIGFTLALFLPNAGVASGSQLVTTMLGFTLWSAAGHLFWLPYVSRRGVLECDHFASKRGLPKRLLNRTFQATEALVSLEQTRSERLEKLFYPTPNRAMRLAIVKEMDAPRGAYQAQQVAVYLSWAGLGLLSRAVWNVGRPQLWVMGAGD